MEVVRIAMWSGPRNLSTAMMRSFGNRSDTFVSDEPFYGAFLETSGALHPMRDEVIAAMDCSWEGIARKLSGPCPDGSPVWYQKHMWHHMVGPVGFDDFAGFTHAFLIRDPSAMIASYLGKRESAAFEDFGLDRQADFFEREADRLGDAPPVVDAGDVLADPEGVLRALCGRLGLAFDPAMLHWPPGRRATDGPWAPHWYRTVESSTGFAPPDAAPLALTGKAAALADRCRPYYEQLAAHRIVAERGVRTPL